MKKIFAIILSLVTAGCAGYSSKKDSEIKTQPIVLSERENLLTEEITKTYNSGQYQLAIEKSKAFLQEYPNSYIARYKYAVMHGDYSYTAGLSPEEKKKYREIGNQGIKALAEDPEIKRWPREFQSRLRNEYYWFYEMPLEQYNLGLEDIALNDLGGHYSATVGASMLAMKTLKAGDRAASEEWAEKSLYHFQKFEEHKPTWANINYFAAQSYACLGKYKESMDAFKGLFRKQKSAAKKSDLAEHQKQIEEIKALRLLRK